MCPFLPPPPPLYNSSYGFASPDLLFQSVAFHCSPKDVRIPFCGFPGPWLDYPFGSLLPSGRPPLKGRNLTSLDLGLFYVSNRSLPFCVLSSPQLVVRYHRRGADGHFMLRALPRKQWKGVPPLSGAFSPPPRCRKAITFPLALVCIRNLLSL